MALHADIIAQLEQAVPGRVYVGEAIKADYAHDEMPIYGEAMPDAVVEVTNTQETAAVCKICYDNDLPIIPRGAGTGLCSGCVAFGGGVIVDTTKMNQILGYDLENFTVRVQSGVLLNDLANDCLEKGVMYPPDPGEKFATVGGNVSTNAGGMRAVKYGTTRDYVKAMTVVLPNGEIVRFGAEVSKTSSGYSLMHLMIGSEGTLGIITELSLKVIPQPKQNVSLLGLFPDLNSAISCVPQVKMAGLDPQTLEFMPRGNVEMIHEFLGKTVYPYKADGEEVEAYLLSTFGCQKEEKLDEIMEKAAETFLENGALDIIVYDTPDAIRNAWMVRSSTLEAILAKYEQSDECDVVVPIPRIPEFINYVTGLEDEVGLAVLASGHAGDGNCHVNVCAHLDLPQEEFMPRAQRCMDLAYAKAAELGGMVSGEHGIGSAKLAYLEKSMGQVTMDLMRGVKRAFDPKGLLNPGKVCGK